MLSAASKPREMRYQVGLLAFINHPAEWARLAANPGLLPTAIEEILRWTSPITHIARVALQDATLRGKKISAGDQLATWLPSANRDEEIFEEPYRFDIGRTPNEQIAFGKGEHSVPAPTLRGWNSA